VLGVDLNAAVSEKHSPNGKKLSSWRFQHRKGLLDRPADVQPAGFPLVEGCHVPHAAPSLPCEKGEGVWRD
jgi:hypothetical protein